MQTIPRETIPWRHWSKFPRMVAKSTSPSTQVKAPQITARAALLALRLRMEATESNPRPRLRTPLRCRLPSTHFLPGSPNNRRQSQGPRGFRPDQHSRFLWSQTCSANRPIRSRCIRARASFCTKQPCFHAQTRCWMYRKASASTRNCTPHGSDCLTDTECHPAQVLTRAGS